MVVMTVRADYVVLPAAVWIQRLVIVAGYWAVLEAVP